jgi:signal transduction histidine kinase/ActR/RegA family two-component response regulator
MNEGCAEKRGSEGHSDLAHSVRFFADDAYPATRIADFIQASLDGGEGALMFATPEHQASVTRVLESRRVDLARTVDARRLQFGDAEAAARSIVERGRANRAAFEDIVAAPLLEAVSRFGRVGAYGEIVDVLARAGDFEGALALEGLWNELLRGAPARLLCGYSFKAFLGPGSMGAFSHVCGEHDGVEVERGGSIPDAARLIAELEQRTLALEHELAQRSEIQRERDLLLERAESANRAKDEFLAMLGHELRNPLSPILTAVQLMRLRADAVLVKERTIIERQVNHMVRLVDDLLDVSRIAQGRVELRVAPVEMATVVADAVEMVSPLLEERSHRLQTSVPPNGLVVNADAGRIAQVVANLLTNAAKYTPAHGVIRITARRNGRIVELSVADDGIGIEPALLPHVFELFVQGRQASDRPHGGLGLGLSIAKNLVEMHGGSLRAKSEGVGRGSVFTLELDLLPRKARDVSSSSFELPLARVVRRILVVDDNRDAADVLADYLQAAGHVTRVAYDGVSALEVAPEFRPEVALLDLGLPVMDGHELARRLVSLLAEAPPKLVAITGYGDHVDRRRSTASGFHHHLVKPVVLDELTELVDGSFATCQSLTSDEKQPS